MSYPDILDCIRELEAQVAALTAQRDAADAPAYARCTADVVAWLWEYGARQGDDRGADEWDRALFAARLRIESGAHVGAAKRGV